MCKQVRYQYLCKQCNGHRYWGNHEPLDSKHTRRCGQYDSSERRCPNVQMVDQKCVLDHGRCEQCQHNPWHGHQLVRYGGHQTVTPALVSWFGGKKTKKKSAKKQGSHSRSSSSISPRLQVVHLDTSSSRSHGKWARDKAYIVNSAYHYQPQQYHAAVAEGGLGPWEHRQAEDVPYGRPASNHDTSRATSSPSRTGSSCSGSDRASTNMTSASSESSRNSQRTSTKARGGEQRMKESPGYGQRGRLQPVLIPVR